MARDGVQPAGELCRLAQLRQRLERDQKSVLRHVLGGPAARSQRLRGHQQNSPAKPTNQFVEGRQVPDEGGEHELLVGHFGVTRANTADLGCCCCCLVHAVRFVRSGIKEPAARGADRGFRKLSPACAS